MTEKSVNCPSCSAKSEAKVVNAIGHPNIIDIFAFGEMDGMQYFVMEYLDGIEFSQYLKKKAFSPTKRQAPSSVNSLKPWQPHTKKGLLTAI